MIPTHTPIWDHPEFTKWVDANTNISYRGGAVYALETKTLATDVYLNAEGRKLRRLRSDAIAEMGSLGGHMFYQSDDLVLFGWDTAVVKIVFEELRQKTFLTHVAYHGLCGELLAAIETLSKGWFGRRAKRVVCVPDTELYMLANTSGRFHLSTIGAETEVFVPENYDPKVVKAFDTCKGGLISASPSGRMILLDGPPGTGKTRFVRALLGSLHNSSRVIIVPEHLTANLADPQLITVLAECTETPTVLVLEDADDCLKSREATDDRGSSRALASLLNLSDGIIGAMLDLRIIATTNIRITKMDQAVLRPGRLLKRVEFGHLERPQAAAILSRITKGAENCELPEGPWTLADVYATATNFLEAQ